MTLNIVTKREAPLPPYICEMVDLDMEAVPFMLGALWLRAQKYWWLTPDDQMVGRQLMNKEMVGMLMPCSIDITNRQDALYNMLDARLGGILRDVTGSGTYDDPYVYDEPIPQVVDPIIYSTPGMQYNSVQVLAGLRNLANGTVSTGWADNRVFRQTLVDILNAIGAESDEASIALLQKIALALGAVL
jgi:hypothetical protein